LPNANNIAVKRRPTLPQEDNALPSNKLQKTFHGTKNNLFHQELCRDKASFFSRLLRDSNVSLKKAGKDMHVALSAANVRLFLSSYIKMINQATKNGCVGTSPQKFGGVALPFTNEKNLQGRCLNFFKSGNFPTPPAI
jgi:hypothetical protein